MRGYRERERESKGMGGEKRMGGIFGLVEKKGSGIFFREGALGDAASLCRDANFSPYSINNGEFG